MEALKGSADTLFILLGAVMVLAMHAGFAFLELGTVRRKSQVNALVKILTDFAASTIAYFFIGYAVAYGVHFFTGAQTLAQASGYALVIVHCEPQLIERVNAYLGYGAVARLKLTQGALPHRTRVESQPDSEPAAPVPGIEDAELAAALGSFAQALRRGR